MLPRFLVSAADVCIQAIVPKVLARCWDWLISKNWPPKGAERATEDAKKAREWARVQWKTFIFFFHQLQAVVWAVLMVTAMVLAVFRKGSSTVLMLMLTLVFLTVLLYIKVVRGVLLSGGLFKKGSSSSASNVLVGWTCFFFLLAAFFFTAGSTNSASAEEIPFSEGLYSLEFDHTLTRGGVITPPFITPPFDLARCERATKPLPFANASIPVCQMTWSRDLGIYDCALFAELSYHHPELSRTNELALETDLQNWFCGEYDYDVLNNTVRNIHAIVFRSKETNTAVVAVAGTHMGTDVVLDLDIWMEASVIQFLGYVIPGFSLLPIPFFRNVIKVGALFETSFHSYHREFVAQLKQVVVKEKRNGRDVVVVGHSLGGGVAKIIGMLTETPTVSISGAPRFDSIPNSFDDVSLAVD
jgi:hypothetical protein